ncbi:38K protein [Dolichomitus sp. PSUC_FEM 10030005]|nr:38K protein [Dolichomitus sp. PSUC_FEM 10030005]
MDSDYNSSTGHMTNHTMATRARDYRRIKKKRKSPYLQRRGYAPIVDNDDTSSGSVDTDATMNDDDEDYRDTRKRRGNGGAAQQSTEKVLKERVGKQKKKLIKSKIVRPSSSNSATLSRKNASSLMKETPQRMRQLGPAVIVLDLDDTLIDKKNQLFPRVGEFLRKIFMQNIVILWTAGNDVHAEAFLKQNPALDKFKRIIAGLHQGTKDAHYVDTMIRKKNIYPYVLIDDNPRYFVSGDYDVTINVMKYYRSGENLSNYILYNDILCDVVDKINAWYKKRKNNRKVTPTTRKNTNRQRIELASDYETD